MVLFLFVLMLLDRQAEQEAQPQPLKWRGAVLLTAVLLLDLIYLILNGNQGMMETTMSPQQVGLTLFGPYLLGVELASMLLLAGLLGSYHLGRRQT
jgi:NADH-quinone oxidoreductase subunit J